MLNRDLGEIDIPKLKVVLFVEPGRIVPNEKPIPDVGPPDAQIHITATTIYDVLKVAITSWV